MTQVNESERMLRDALTKARMLLEDVGETNWSARLREAAEKSPIDLTAIRSWFGGMGSFNDVLIARVNGHRIEPLDEKTKNDLLNKLRRQIYELSAT
ncbi:hypothetical protein SAMN05444169_6797 [Bradyrhizobium erythrophlei]|jgi:hypothetical protein|uniref:DUF6966 domain-containing protein n=2 Tax=Bradyrhizobium erythrophlei TaxID=1437360 RepID=A0A1M5RW58_9BRAD|nr:hypothetical protein SAMN05444169_6797 [Bradyrhizobium erythrophlei]